MKLTTRQMTGVIPVSTHTVIRYQSHDPEFPQPERIGRTNYFDQTDFFAWLNGRAMRNNEPAPSGTICTVDKLLDTSGVCALLSRSVPWVWSNVTKNPNITQVDLSPSGTSKNPRRYFIEQEIINAYPVLAVLAGQEVG